jgi:hypothetical protein
VGKIVYQYGVKNNVTIPAGRCDKQHASSDWLSPSLKERQSIHSYPQAMCLGRATSFNKHNVEMFFANLGKVYDKYNFQCQDIYNVDETAVTKVQNVIKFSRAISRVNVESNTKVSKTSSLSIIRTSLRNDQIRAAKVLSLKPYKHRPGSYQVKV